MSLVGVWRLRSFVIESPSGAREEWGPHPSGLLIYTADGYMSVAFNRDVVGDPRDPARIYDAVLSYSGRYELREPGVVVHFVEQSSEPARIGQEIVREVALRDGELLLVGRGEFGVATVTWSRV